MIGVKLVMDLKSVMVFSFITNETKLNAMLITWFIAPETTPNEQ